MYLARRAHDIWRGDGVGDYWLNLLFDYIISSLLTHPASPTPGRFHRRIEPTDACSIPADDFANPRPGTPRSSSAPRHTHYKPSNAARRGAQNWHRSGTDAAGIDANEAELVANAPRQAYGRRWLSNIVTNGAAAMDPTLPSLTLSKKDLIQLFFAMVPRMNGGTLLGFMTLLPSE